MISRWILPLATLAMLVVGPQVLVPTAALAEEAAAPATLKEAFTMAKANRRPVLILGTAHG